MKYEEITRYTPQIELQYASYIGRAREVLENRYLDPDFAQPSINGLVDLICGHRDQRSAFSLIRFGDGEGACLLEINQQFPELYRAVVARTLGLHFGKQPYGEEDFAFWHRSVSIGAQNADIIAAPSPGIVCRVLAAPSADIRGTVGLLGGAEFMINNKNRLRARTYDGGHVHVALLPHFDRILNGGHVLLISCYGPAFGEKVARAYSCADVQLIDIPGQALNERGNLKSPLYPEHYERLAKLVAGKARPGQVCLVGAGLAGKHFCALAAQSGAVAIDVGSMMDVWNGRGVRGYQKEEFVERHRL